MGTCLLSFSPACFPPPTCTLLQSQDLCTLSAQNPPSTPHGLLCALQETHNPPTQTGLTWSYSWVPLLPVPRGSTPLPASRQISGSQAPVPTFVMVCNTGQYNPLQQFTVCEFHRPQTRGLLHLLILYRILASHKGSLGCVNDKMKVQTHEWLALGFECAQPLCPSAKSLRQLKWPPLISVLHRALPEQMLGTVFIID